MSCGRYNDASVVESPARLALTHRYVACPTFSTVLGKSTRKGGSALRAETPSSTTPDAGQFPAFFIPHQPRWTPPCRDMTLRRDDYSSSTNITISSINIWQLGLDRLRCSNRTVVMKQEHINHRDRQAGLNGDNQFGGAQRYIWVIMRTREYSNASYSKLAGLKPFELMSTDLHPHKYIYQ